MADSRTARVLVVEDDADLLSLFQVVLENEGYTVDLASDGVEALEKAAAQPPELLVLDLRVPRIDGWTVLDRLRQAGGAPPTVVVTSVDERERARREGAAACLLKPFHFWDLIEACARALR